MKIRLPRLHHWLNRVDSWWRKFRGVDRIAPRLLAPQPAGPTQARRLEQLVLSEDVAGTLFRDYAEHCVSPRGHEEIGWLLMGVRRGAEAVALAALPAGAERDASQVHVQFNADAQAIASRILRQTDRRLEIVGIVHTHPGNLSEPSAGDFAGDSAWVAKLRHREAVFGIGTGGATDGGLRFSWYGLAAGDADYRPLPARVEPGPDLAAGLRAVWPALESHGAALERLCRLFARVHFEPAQDCLAVKIALPGPWSHLRILLKGQDACYYGEESGELVAVDPREPNVERAVFSILAELANEPASMIRPAPELVES